MDGKGLNSGSSFGAPKSSSWFIWHSSWVFDSMLFFPDKKLMKKHNSRGGEGALMDDSPHKPTQGGSQPTINTNPHIKVTYHRLLQPWQAITYDRIIRPYANKNNFTHLTFYPARGWVNRMNGQINKHLTVYRPLPPPPPTTTTTTTSVCVERWQLGLKKHMQGWARVVEGGGY